MFLLQGEEIVERNIFKAAWMKSKASKTQIFKVGKIENVRKEMGLYVCNIKPLKLIKARIGVAQYCRRYSRLDHV